MKLFPVFYYKDLYKNLNTFMVIDNTDSFFTTSFRRDVKDYQYFYFQEEGDGSDKENIVSSCTL